MLCRNTFADKKKFLLHLLFFYVSWMKIFYEMQLNHSSIPVLPICSFRYFSKQKPAHSLMVPLPPEKLGVQIYRNFRTISRFFLQKIWTWRLIFWCSLSMDFSRFLWYCERICFGLFCCCTALLCLSESTLPVDSNRVEKCQNINDHQRISNAWTAAW